jgi:hypothetical protein
MRIREGFDRYVLNICKLLHIPLVPFYMNGEDKLSHDDGNNFLTLRGERVRLSEFNSYTVSSMTSGSSKLKYEFKVKESVCAPTMLLIDCLNKIKTLPVKIEGPLVDMCDTKTNRQKFQDMTEDPDMKEWQDDAYWTVVGGVNADAFNLANDYFGYYVHDQLESPFSKFTNSSFNSFLRPLYGLHELTLRPAAAFVRYVTKNARVGGTDDGPTDHDDVVAKGTAAGIIHVNHALISLQYSEKIEYKYKLTFAKTVTSQCTGRTQIPTSNDSFKVVYANKVILAMPQASIITLDSTPLHGTSGRDLDELVRNNLPKAFVKLFGVYNVPGDELWIRKPPMSMSAGRSVSDEFANQLFAWYPGTASLTPYPKCPDISVTQVYVGGPVREEIFKYFKQRMDAQFEKCDNITDANECVSCTSPESFGPPSDGITKGFANFILEELALMTNVKTSNVTPFSRLM